MKKNVKYIVVFLVVAIIVLIICLVAFIKPDKKEEKKDADSSLENYTRFGKPYKDPNSIVVASDTLVADHCVDNICVSITKITCNDNRGRIFYKITNKGNEKTNGKVKISFPEKSISVNFKDLNVGSTHEASYIYDNSNLKQVSDFNIALT